MSIVLHDFHSFLNNLIVKLPKIVYILYLFQKRYIFFNVNAIS